MKYSHHRSNRILIEHYNKNEVDSMSRKDIRKGTKKMI
jgi:hypothetical protein